MSEPRPGADSTMTESIPSFASTPFTYSAALVSLPGGLEVSMRTSSCKIFVASALAAAKSGCCAEANTAQISNITMLKLFRIDTLLSSMSSLFNVILRARSVRAEDLCKPTARPSVSQYLSLHFCNRRLRIRRARPAALRHLFRPPAASTARGHRILQQRAHIKVEAGGAAEHQRRLAGGRSQQRDRFSVRIGS